MRSLDGKRRPLLPPRALSERALETSPHCESHAVGGLVRRETADTETGEDRFSQGAGWTLRQCHLILTVSIQAERPEEVLQGAGHKCGMGPRHPASRFR